MAIKDDLKSLLSKHGITLTRVVEELNRINEETTTVQNLSNKLNRGTIKYSEVEQILNIIGYQIIFNPIEDMDNTFSYTHSVGGVIKPYGAIGALATTIGGITGILGKMGGFTNSTRNLATKEIDEKYTPEEANEIYEKILEKFNIVQDKYLDAIIKEKLEQYVDKSIDSGLIKIIESNDKKKEDK